MVMLMTTTLRRLTVVTLQKLSHSFLPRQFGGTPGIHLLHFRKLFISHIRKMPNEINEIPTFCILVRDCSFGETWHSRKPDSVLDDVVQLAVS